MSGHLEDSYGSGRSSLDAMARRCVEQVEKVLESRYIWLRGGAEKMLPGIRVGRRLLQRSASGGGRAGLIWQRWKRKSLFLRGEENGTMEPRMVHATRFNETAALGR